MTSRPAPRVLTVLLTVFAFEALHAQSPKPAPAKPAAQPAPAESPLLPPDKVIQDKGAGELDLTQFPGQVIGEVIVPVPSEIFTVLDKLGDPDWKAELGTSPKVTFSERTDVALLLGSIVADGFIAVQAEDRKSVENVGRSVLSLSKSLGVENDVIRHCQAITDAADKANWDGVRQELDATQATVRARMAEMQDGAAAECISVGGWLRGTQVITNVIGKSYSAERAELLFQPDLADYFNDALEEMLSKAKNPDKLKEIANGLARLRELMDNGGENITPAAVREMHTLTAALVKKIITKG
ncbi:MAG: hypothetical protein V4726_02915 [Verrucomicrobiota bacterium]